MPLSIRPRNRQSPEAQDLAREFILESGVGVGVDHAWIDATQERAEAVKLAALARLFMG